MAPAAIAGLDHTLVGVRDLAAAAAAWARLGFTLTPRGRHIGWGTANYCIMLEAGYVELLGIIDPAQFTNDLDRFLAEREGLMGLAFASADAAATARALAALGIAAEGPKALARLLELPEGAVRPRFSLLFPAPAATPELAAFVCQHLTPGLLRRPDWLAHPNGARRLLGVTVVSDRPAAAAAGYAPLFGRAAVTAEGAAGRVETGGGWIRFVTPAGLAALFPGLAPLPGHPRPWLAAQTVAVAELRAAAAGLEAAGIPWAPTAAGLAVGPDHATGTVLELVAG